MILNMQAYFQPRAFTPEILSAQNVSFLCIPVAHFLILLRFLLKYHLQRGAVLNNQILKS